MRGRGVYNAKVADRSNIYNELSSPERDALEMSPSPHDFFAVLALWATYDLGSRYDTR